jgi:hypothetical protein
MKPAGMDWFKSFEREGHTIGAIIMCFSTRLEKPYPRHRGSFRLVVASVKLSIEVFIGKGYSNSGYGFAATESLLRALMCRNARAIG